MIVILFELDASQASVLAIINASPIVRSGEPLSVNPSGCSDRTHIELDRIFLPYKDEDESAPDMLRAMAASGLDRICWSDLLEMTRVVILAEAGTGKTHELLETARRLRREGKAAFFCRIEDLAADSFWHALSEGNREEFETWVEGSNAAWFFLDSVEEARLANPRFFERALRTLARTLDHATSRAHIFITARVSTSNCR